MTNELQKDEKIIIIFLIIALIVVFTCQYNKNNSFGYSNIIENALIC